MRTIPPPSSSTNQIEAKLDFSGKEALIQKFFMLESILSWLFFGEQNLSHIERETLKDFNTFLLTHNDGPVFLRMIQNFKEKLATLLNTQKPRGAQKRFEEAIFDEPTIDYDDMSFIPGARCGFLKEETELLSEFLDDYPVIARFFQNQLLNDENEFAKLITRIVDLLNPKPNGFDKKALIKKFTQLAPAFIIALSKDKKIEEYERFMAWLSHGGGANFYETIVQFNVALKILFEEFPQAEQAFKKAVLGVSINSGLLHKNPQLLSEFLENYPKIARFFQSELLDNHRFAEANAAIVNFLDPSSCSPNNSKPLLYHEEKEKNKYTTINLPPVSTFRVNTFERLKDLAKRFDEAHQELKLKNSNASPEKQFATLIQIFSNNTSPPLVTSEEEYTKAFFEVAGAINLEDKFDGRKTQSETAGARISLTSIANKVKPLSLPLTQPTVEKGESPKSSLRSSSVFPMLTESPVLPNSDQGTSPTVLIHVPR